MTRESRSAPLVRTFLQASSSASSSGSKATPSNSHSWRNRVSWTVYADPLPVRAFLELVELAVAGEQVEHVVGDGDALEVGMDSLRSERELLRPGLRGDSRSRRPAPLVAVGEEPPVAGQRQPRDLREVAAQNPPGDHRAPAPRRNRAGRGPAPGGPPAGRPRRCRLGRRLTPRPHGRPRRPARTARSAPAAGILLTAPSPSLAAFFFSTSSRAPASPISRLAPWIESPAPVRIAVSTSSRVVDFRIFTR